MIINVKPKIYFISCVVSEITSFLNMYSIRQKNWHNQLYVNNGCNSRVHNYVFVDYVLDTSSFYNNDYWHNEK